MCLPLDKFNFVRSFVHGLFLSDLIDNLNLLN